MFLLLLLALLVSLRRQAAATTPGTPMATEKARQLLARLAATPDAAVPNLPFLHRALLLPLLSAASALLRLPVILSSPLRSRRTLPVPVISVGNLTWGGNGKTPMVDLLARRFHTMGVSPLILTRVNSSQCCLYFNTFILFLIQSFSYADKIFSKNEGLFISPKLTFHNFRLVHFQYFIYISRDAIFEQISHKIWCCRVMRAAMNLRCSGGALLILPPRLGLAQTGLLWLLPCCRSMAMWILVMPSAGRSFRQCATEWQAVKVRKLESLYWTMECRYKYLFLIFLYRQLIWINPSVPWNLTSKMANTVASFIR